MKRTQLDQFMQICLLNKVLRNSMFQLCEGFLNHGYMYAESLINKTIAKVVILLSRHFTIQYFSKQL